LIHGLILCEQDKYLALVDCEVCSQNWLFSIQQLQRWENFENLDARPDPAGYFRDLTRESVEFAEGLLIHSQAAVVETVDLESWRIPFVGMSYFAEVVDKEVLLMAAQSTAIGEVDKV